MADRVSYRPAEKAATGRGGSADVSSTSVEVTTRDGRRFEHRSTGVPGDPKNPVSWDQIEAKFRDCVSFSAKPVSPGNVDKAAGLIRNLEDLADASALIRLLS
jgi:2-methylcitrate dehydratase PrpD